MVGKGNFDEFLGRTLIFELGGWEFFANFAVSLEPTPKAAPKNDTHQNTIQKADVSEIQTNHLGLRLREGHFPSNN